MNTTNLDVAEWSSVFGDARMNTVLPDRLSKRFCIVNTGNDAIRHLSQQVRPKQACWLGNSNGLPPRKWRMPRERSNPDTHPQLAGKRRRLPYLAHYRLDMVDQICTSKVRQSLSKRLGTPKEILVELIEIKSTNLHQMITNYCTQQHAIKIRS